mmetsp:Transcript_26953/g.83433  ORF Transcript_26953/g.83433 Transcript_26953/m.83433 type:complete len:287 (+) Transcript_26953:1151-2011(+)
MNSVRRSRTGPHSASPPAVKWVESAEHTVCTMSAAPTAACNAHTSAISGADERTCANGAVCASPSRAPACAWSVVIAASLNLRAARRSASARSSSTSDWRCALRISVDFTASRARSPSKARSSATVARRARSSAETCSDWLSRSIVVFNVAFAVSNAVRSSSCERSAACNAEAIRSRSASPSRVKASTRSVADAHVRRSERSSASRSWIRRCASVNMDSTEARCWWSAVSFVSAAASFASAIAILFFKSFMAPRVFVSSHSIDFMFPRTRSAECSPSCMAASSSRT